MRPVGNKALTDLVFRNARDIDGHSGSLLTLSIFEPRHVKTNKMSVRPVKTRISLGIRSVSSESSLSA